MPPPVIDLLSLPPELHLLIYSHLDFPASTHFRLTCSYLYNFLPASSHTDLLMAETTDFAVSKDLYACRYCLRLRAAGCFADRMLCRGRGRRGRNARKRFCIECGLCPRSGGEARYGRGAIVVTRGTLQVVCIECGRFGKGVSVPGEGGLRCTACGNVATHGFQGQ
ncbi:hypothetical protein BDW60DRAFT_56007 [Aspergillus nidulans var. acristatus]